MAGKIRRFVNVPHLIDKISPYVFEAKLDIETTKKKETRIYHTNFLEYEEYKGEIFSEYYNEEKDDLNFYAFSTLLQKFYTQNSDREEIISKLVEEINDKVVIFVRFLSSIPEGANKITGEESQKERAEMIERFRRGEFNALYITYGCGAFGLNLQFCKNMIFAEHTWDYAVREQAEARIYRLGQGSEVKYYDLICGGIGLEDLISTCVRRKSRMLDTVKQEIQKCKSAKDFIKTL